METQTKEKVRLLYKKVQERKAEIEKAERGTYVTDGEFMFGKNAQHVDIKTCRNVNQLRDIVAFLLEKEGSVKRANEMLGISESFLWDGATVENWISDVKVRISQIQLVKRKEELSVFESTLLQMDASLLAEIRLEEMEKALA